MKRCDKQWKMTVLAVVGLVCIVAVPAPVIAQADIQDQGGSIMAGPISVFLIFWLPTNSVYDSGAGLNPPGIGNYETLIQRFFADVSGSSYFDILTQYPGTCGAIPARQSCYGTVSVGGTFLESRAYPHTGTQQDPLQDGDIRNEIQRIITQSNLTPTLNNEFFVFTAANIQACTPWTNTGCTFVQNGIGFCAYHSAFTDSNGNTVVYAYMPNVSSLGSGCAEGVSKSPNGQTSTDREVVAVTHEFCESVSDPLIDNWHNANNQEIGDNCNQLLRSVASDGSNVTLNGNSYVVQSIWSNNDSDCVLTGTHLTGPSVENTISTGQPLYFSSSAIVLLQAGAASQSATLKPASQPSWNPGSTHVRVLPFTAIPLPGTLPQNTPLTDETFSLFSPSISDQWTIGFMDAKLRNPNGTLVCEQTSNIDIGNPPVVSDSHPYAFQTPNCQFGLFIMGGGTQAKVGETRLYEATFWTNGVIDPALLGRFGPIQWTVSGPVSWTPSSTIDQFVTYTGPGVVTVNVDVTFAGSHLLAGATTSVTDRVYNPQQAALEQLIQEILSTQIVHDIINPLGPDVPFIPGRIKAIQVLNTLQQLVNQSANPSGVQ